MKKRFNTIQNNSSGITSNLSRNSSFRDKSNIQKKTIQNVCTIFQMNNMKKDYENIFNNEFISADKKNNKKTDDYEFIIPLNNSIDEKIGLDKIEFIDQRNFGNLNSNNLDSLNKKTTAEQTFNSNFQSNYVSNYMEKSENLPVENNFLSLNDDFMTHKTINQQDFDCYEVIDNQTKNNQEKTQNVLILDYCDLKCDQKIPWKLVDNQNEFQFGSDEFVKKTNHNFNEPNQDNSQEFETEKFSKVKSNLPKQYKLNLNDQINKKIQVENIQKEIIEKSKDKLIKKISFLSCDYEEEIFEENSIIKLKDFYHPFTRGNSKREIDASFSKKSNTIDNKNSHFRVNSCDNIFLNSKNIDKINLNKYKINSTVEENENNIPINNKKNIKYFYQVKCDMETHNHTNKKAKEYIKCKKNKILEKDNYSYDKLKNNLKNIEFYSTPSLDNTILKYKKQRLENLERESFSRFLINSYLTNVTQEKFDLQNLNISQKFSNPNFCNNNLSNYLILNDENIFSKNNNGIFHETNSIIDSNNNNHLHSSKIENKKNNFGNFTHENYETYDLKNLLQIQNYHVNINKNLNNFDNNLKIDKEENLQNLEYSSSNLNSKKFIVAKTYNTIQSQTESENKTENNIASDTKIKQKSSQKNTTTDKKCRSPVYKNLNFNYSSETKEKYQLESTEINICPECEINEKLKDSQQFINESIGDEAYNDRNHNQEKNIDNIGTNILDNKIEYNFSSNLKFYPVLTNCKANNLRNFNSSFNNTSYPLSRFQSGFLQTNISNPFTSNQNNNILHTRSMSNNYGYLNNQLNSLENTRLLSEVQNLKNSRSLNKDDLNALYCNRISINSIKPTLDNEDNILIEKTRNPNISTLYHKSNKILNCNENKNNFKFFNDEVNKYSIKPNNQNIINNINTNYKTNCNQINNNHNSNQNKENIKIQNSSNNYNSISNNNSNNVNISNPYFSNSEYYSLQKNPEKLRETTEKKLFYSCSPPSTIKRKKENLTNNKFFSLKQKLYSNTMNNSYNNNNTSLIDEFNNKSSILQDATNSLKFLDLTKEVISLKHDKTQAEIKNFQFQNHLNHKNSQLEKLHLMLNENKKKTKEDRNVIKGLELKVGILNNKLEHMKSEKILNVKKDNKNNISMNLNNISNFINSSANRSLLVSKKELEIKKNIKLINKHSIPKKNKNLKELIDTNNINVSTQIKN